MTTWIARPAECVLPGHPDKLADAMADAIVQEAWRRDRHALVGVEVALHRDVVFVDGRVGGDGAADIDVAARCREVAASAGYGESFGPHPDRLRIVTDLDLGPLVEHEADYRQVSDDQSIVTGWATTRAGVMRLPVEQLLARRMGRALARLRTERPDLGLGPDGKVLVVVEESDDGCLSRLGSVSLSAHHGEVLDRIALERAARGMVAAECERLAADVPGFDPVHRPEMLVNGTGWFACGGPRGDNGLSGKKLVVDAYGPRVAIGGGALSGKDFWKADRAGAILARRAAIVIASWLEVPHVSVILAIRPGETEFRLRQVSDPSGPVAELSRLASLLDLRLAGIAETLPQGLDFVDLARWGHFGREGAAAWCDEGGLVGVGKGSVQPATGDAADAWVAPAPR